MMPLKEGKILPPCARQAKNLNMFFLLNSVEAPAIPHEPCMTDVKGSNIGLSNRLGDTFIPYRAQPSLTCRCRIGDNCESDGCSLL
jgi:hypothetical protein